jgi:hypothetical protein
MSVLPFGEAKQPASPLAKTLAPYSPHTRTAAPPAKTTRVTKTRAAAILLKSGWSKLAQTTINSWVLVRE